MGMNSEEHMDHKYFCNWLKLFSLRRLMRGNQLYSSFLFAKLTCLLRCHSILISSNSSHFPKNQHREQMSSSNRLSLLNTLNKPQLLQSNQMTNKFIYDFIWFEVDMLP